MSIIKKFKEEYRNIFRETVRPHSFIDRLLSTAQKIEDRNKELVMLVVSLHHFGNCPICKKPIEALEDHTTDCTLAKLLKPIKED